jgi:hypothetical protein
MLVDEPDSVFGTTAVPHYGAPLETDGLGHHGPGLGMVIDDENAPALSCHAAMGSKEDATRLAREIRGLGDAPSRADA